MVEKRKFVSKENTKCRVSGTQKHKKSDRFARSL